MRPLRYSINLTLDGCCDHMALEANEEMHQHGLEMIARADALLFGRMTYQMMESAFRAPALGAMPDSISPFARTIDAAKKYVVSDTLKAVDWNAELVTGELGPAVQRLKDEPGEGLYTGGVTLPMALAEMGLQTSLQSSKVGASGSSRNSSLPATSAKAASTEIRCRIGVIFSTGVSRSVTISS